MNACAFTEADADRARRGHPAVGVGPDAPKLSQALVEGGQLELVSEPGQDTLVMHGRLRSVEFISEDELRTVLEVAITDGQTGEVLAFAVDDQLLSGAGQGVNPQLVRSLEQAMKYWARRAEQGLTALKV